MTDVTTPVPANTIIGKAIASYLVGLGIAWDSAGNEILGLLTASPDPLSLAGRLKSILTALGTPLQAGGAVSITGTPSVNLGTIAGAATDAKLELVRALLATGIGVTSLPVTAAQDATLQSILTAIVNDRDETVFTDDSGAFYLRVDKNGTITWTDVAGNASSAPGTGARPAAGPSVLLDRQGFQAVAGGTGYSTGDFLDHMVTTNPGGAVLGNFWINASTGAKLTTVPASANITPITSLPANAATQTTLAAVLAALTGTLLTSTALTASENRIGAVGGLTAVPTAAVTRPGNATAYAVGQLIANSTTAGSVAPLALAVARINGGTGSVRRVRLSSSRAGPGTDVVRVHLFKGSAAATPPTTTVGDGGAVAAAINLVGAIHLGYADVTLSLVGSDGSKGIAAPAVGGEISFDCWAGQATIYALLEARSAITPASGETLTIALETLRD